MPLSRDVIHPDMLRRMAPVAFGAMLDACTIHAPASGDPVLNETTLTITSPTAPLIYSGRCRVQPVADTSDRSEVVGQQEVLVRRYAVWVPRDVDVAIDSVLTLTASQDAALVGRRLHVADVRVSSLEVERDLMCVEYPLQEAP